MKNVILIVEESLRYDYAVTIPMFQELRGMGLFFERMYVSSTFTIGNLCSIRSGMYPPRHGWRTWPISYGFKEEEIKTLEDFLSEADYNIISNMKFPWDPHTTQQLLINEKQFKQATTERPFFLYAHHNHLHDLVFPAIGSANADRLFYRENLDPIDKYIRNTFLKIRSHGLNDDTLVVIIADHGIGLSGDGAKIGRDDYGAGQIYDFRTRVPCAIVGPGIEPKVVKNAYSNIDLLPTILDYCGIFLDYAPSHLKPQGVSAFSEPDDSRLVYIEAQSPNSIWPSDEPNVFGATDGKVKVMQTPDGDLCFDLIADPEEQRHDPEFLSSDRGREMLEFIERIKRSG